MKNKFLLTLFTLVVLGGCSSIQEEEQEEPEVLLYKQSQDRINAKNYIGAVESLSRIERFYPFGVYAEQARADLIYAFYMTGDYDSAYATYKKVLVIDPKNKTAIKKSKELEKRNDYNPYKGIKDKGF